MECKNCGHEIKKIEGGFKHAFEVFDDGMGKSICNSAKAFFRSDIGEVMVSICGCFNPEPKEKLLNA